MEFYERNTYTVKAGTDAALQAFADKYKDDYDNKSHVVRCAIILFFREQRKKGKYISEDVKNG